MPVLIDVEAAPACCVDHALDDMAKAMAISSTDGPTMWDRLPNRFAAALVEQSTQHFQSILLSMEQALGRFLGGDVSVLHKADVPWLRWSEAHFEMVRARLESIGPDAFGIDDWMLLVDYLIQRYLPDDVIQREADYLAVRAALLGKIQANLGRDPRVTDALIGRVVELLPTDFAHVPPKVLTPLETSILEYGRAHAGENIRSVSDTARHRMATIVLEHVQGGLLGQREGRWSYAKVRLFDEFSVLNRDFRRIAVTEGGEIVNQGYVAALQPGQQVERIEAYRGACPFCKSIHGKVFTVVPPDKPNKDGDTEVWVGKTNVGRSASPMKRADGGLVERESNEMWWPAAGVQHPHCRGAWAPVTQKPPAVSQEFFDYLQATLDAAERAADGQPAA